jgi:hypothetical protein
MVKLGYDCFVPCSSLGTSVCNGSLVPCRTSALDGFHPPRRNVYQVVSVSERSCPGAWSPLLVKQEAGRKSLHFNIVSGTKPHAYVSVPAFCPQSAFVGFI